MPFTQTSHQSTFYRPPPTNTTLTFPRPTSLDGPKRPPTIINIHAGSEYSTQYHWHETYTEYIRVTSGAALITISGVSKIYTAKDEVAQVPRYARHEWMRFDRPARLLNQEQREAQEAFCRALEKEEFEKLKAENVIAEEWTDPADGRKEIFFRNILSTISEPEYEDHSSRLGGLWKTLQINCVMWELDNYPVLVDVGGWRGGWRALIEAMCTFGVMACLVVLGRLCGCRAVHEEYTPEYLIKRWENGRPKSE